MNDSKRFEEALLYVAIRGSQIPDLGLTKIYKTLAIADVLAMSSLGETITRWTYLKFERGPVPVQGPEILAGLEERQIVRTLPVNVGPYKLKRVIPQVAPSFVNLTPEEVSLLDMAIGIVARLDAKGASKMSHELPIWRWAEKDRSISKSLFKYPYRISEKPLKGKERDKALESAREQGLL